MRPRVPSRDVQLDQAIARHPERDDVIDTRARVIAKVAWWRDTNQPFFAGERAQALRDPPMTCDPGKAQSNMRQMHDPQPRLAITQDELRLTGRGLRVVTGLGTLTAGSQRRDDLAIGRKGLSRQVFDIQHAPGQWARIAHCSSLPSDFGPYCAISAVSNQRQFPPWERRCPST